MQSSSFASRFQMSPRAFLREFWQKKPLLVRGAMTDLARGIITPERLAGLSCDDGVESRVVREKGGARPWEVTWGPHDEEFFTQLPARGWTLLVQELNRHRPRATRLFEPFSFLPNVRVDDIMVSYAAPGGSVGPHLDSYDVFLVQGKGRRRWKYGTSVAPDHVFRKGLDLRILEHFTYDADVIVEPGDVLYLPPGFAHHGVAVTPCLTYSVGFRAPSLREMWQSYASYIGCRPELAHGDALLSDPPLVPANNPGAIPEAILKGVRQAVRALPLDSDDAIDRWFASFATQLRPGHRLTPPESALSASRIVARLRKGRRVIRTEEGRWAFLPDSQKRNVLLFVGGEEKAVPAGAADLARALCSKREWAGEELLSWSRTRDGRQLLTELFAMGALRFAGATSK